MLPFLGNQLDWTWETIPGGTVGVHTVYLTQVVQDKDVTWCCNTLGHPLFCQAQSPTLLVNQGVALRVSRLWHWDVSVVRVAGMPLPFPARGDVWANQTFPVTSATWRGGKDFESKAMGGDSGVFDLYTVYISLLSLLSFKYDDIWWLLVMVMVMPQEQDSSEDFGEDTLTRPFPKANIQVRLKPWASALYILRTDHSKIVV